MLGLYSIILPVPFFYISPNFIPFSTAPEYYFVNLALIFEEKHDKNITLKAEESVRQESVHIK